MSMIVKWRDIEYLNSPDFSTQSETASITLYASIQDQKILDKIRIFLPVLVGSHALGLETDEEPVQVFCEVYALDSFRENAEHEFKEFSRFQIVEKSLMQRPAVVIRFKADDINFEITGQPLPVEEQAVLRATETAKRLLTLSGDEATLKKHLAKQRKEGEDAFTLMGRVLGLKKSGNVSWVEVLASLADADDQKLEELVTYPEYQEELLATDDVEVPKGVQLEPSDEVTTPDEPHPLH